MKNDYIYKETKKILKKYKMLFIMKLVTSGLLRGSLLLIPIFWGHAIDGVSVSNVTLAYQMSMVAMLLATGYYIVQAIDHRIFYKLQSRLYESYTNLAYQATSQNSIHSMSRFTLSEYMNVVNNDIEKMSVLFTGVPFRIMRAMEFLVIYGYFLSVNLNVFLVSVIVSLIMFFALYKTSEKTKQNNLIAKSVYDKKTNFIHEMFNNLKEIKSFNIFKPVSNIANDATIKYTEANYKYMVTSGDIKISILMLLEFTKYALVFYGIYLVKEGNLEIGSLLVIYAYFGKLVENFDIFGTIATDFRDLQVSMKRFNKLLEFRLSNKKEKYEFKDVYDGHIMFSDVLYGNMNDPILDNVSFEIKPNSLTAITGKTGSGKSGIFELLIKMNRQHYGDILIDDISYTDIEDEEYHSLISLVTQEPKFFDLSIKDNLVMLDNDMSKIKEMCKYFQIDEYIENLPNGYNTYIYDKNANIPNNVKILIAIIRVLIKNPKIMLFDDVISTLDKKSEHLVLNALLKLKEDHTVVIVTREAELTSLCDNVIVMDNNQVVEVGHHDDLITKKGYYYKLYTLDEISN